MSSELLGHLLDVAHAGHWSGSDQDLALAVERGWVRHVPPDALALIAHHRELKHTCETLRREAGRCGRGAANALLGALWPPRRRALKARADALRDRAEEASREAQGCWLSLSQRDLVALEPELLARGPEGSLLGITDAGREAVRDHLWSAACDPALDADDGSLEAFGRIRAEALAAGFPPDPRLDLAAALAAAVTDSAGPLLALNARAVADGWRHFDRLPILGALTSLDADADRAWERHTRALSWLRRAEEFPPGYETRLAAFLVAASPCAWLAGAPSEGGSEGAGEGGAAARARLVFVLSRLRAEGWSLAPATIPTAVRLASLPIGQAQVVARVRALVGELKHMGEPVGPHSDLAAALGAGTNLHPLAVKHSDARVASLSTPHREFLARLAQARQEIPGREPSGTLLAACLALLPGSVQSHLRRARELQTALAPVLWPGSQAAVIAALLGASAGPWFSPARYVWELCALLEFDDLTSVYTARQRLSPAQSAAQVGASAPSFGPGTAGG